MCYQEKNPINKQYVKGEWDEMTKAIIKPIILITTKEFDKMLVVVDTTNGDDFLVEMIPKPW